MSRTKLSAVLIAAIGLLVWSSAGWSISQEPAPTPATENFEVRYARAKLALAEANLKRVQARNERVANAVSYNVVNQYKNDRGRAQVRLDEALAGKEGSFANWLQSAESNWQAARTAWQSAVAANKRKAGTVDPLDIERMRLNAELLQLQYEQGKQLIDQPRSAQLEWRLGTLSDEVERLSEIVFRTAPITGSPTSVWYYYVPW